MPDARTFADILDRLDHPTDGLTFQSSADDPAPRRIPFAELSVLTRELARRWAGLGVRRGDRVVLIVADEYEFATLFLSALRAGITAVPIYPPFRASEMDAWPGVLRRVCTAAGASRCVVSGPLRDFVATAELDCPLDTYEDLLAAPEGTAEDPRPDDLAFLQFSSGSTGTPKAAAVSHRALVANALAIAEGLATDGTVDRAVSWLPMYHDMGLVGFLLTPLIDQVPVWYLPPLAFGRDPLGWLRLISTIGGTIAFAPNFAYGLVARRAKPDLLEQLDLSAWRIAGCGAEPVHAETLLSFQNMFAAAGFRDTAFMPAYGLAESTLAVSLYPRDTRLATLAVDAEVLAEHGRVQTPTEQSRVLELVACGPPVSTTEVQVRDAAGQALPEGVEGELVLRGPSLADGYFGDEARTDEVWQDGWLHSGDRGFLHCGQIYVTGRIKDVIVINGRNYHPQDIERATLDVPGVRIGNVAALAVRSGHTEGVRVVVSSRTRRDPAELRQEVKNAVGGQMGLVVTDVVLVAEELPKTSSGKLRRAETAAMLARGELRPIEV
jgi:fatty-acyl-CoA synthase